MAKRLKRTSFEKVGSAVMISLVLVMFWFTFNEVGLIGKIGVLVCCMAASINFVFILSTPAAKIVNSELFLYASAQPIFFSLCPQVIDIDRITDLEISRNLIEHRAIFSLPHGDKYYYHFPRASTKSIDNLLEFLANNTDSKIIKATYKNYKSRQAPN